MALLSIYQSLPNLQFAFQHLNLLFAVLATLGVTMTGAIVPLSVILALWRVARLRERSSLVATLDPRLTPNYWVYVNKLLDLPRTPLRTPRTAAAYVLALAGALLMIASMMYLITVGGVGNKLAALALFSKHDLIQESIAASSIEVRHIVLLLPFAFAGVKLAALLQSTAKKLGGLRVSDVVKNTDDKFVLYYGRSIWTTLSYPSRGSRWRAGFFPFGDTRCALRKSSSTLQTTIDRSSLSGSRAQPGQFREAWPTVPIFPTRNGENTWRRGFDVRNELSW